jgi:hypothetical protein
MNQAITSRFPSQEDGLVELLKRFLGGNSNLAVLSSAARTASTTSADFVSNGFRGLHVFLNVTAVTGSPMLTMRLQGKCPVTAQYTTIATTTAAITGVTCGQWIIAPGCGTASGASLNSAVCGISIPQDFRIQIIHGTADSVTYQVTGVLIP